MSVRSRVMSDTSSAWVAEQDPDGPGLHDDECSAVNLGHTLATSGLDTQSIKHDPQPARTLQKIRARCRDVTLLRRLGSGGCADVYLGYDPQQGQVAIKIGKAGDGTSRSLLEERRTLWRLTHRQKGHPPVAPNMLFAGRLLDEREYGTEERHFFGMEVCDGSEDDIGERMGSPSLQYAYWSLAETADLIHRAHTRFGLVHADLKPANVMLRRTPVQGRNGIRYAVHRLLSDWAFAFDAERPQLQTHHDGILKGCTPQYSPPEQLGVGRTRDKRSEMYAFGGTAFTMFTGKPPNSDLRRPLDLMLRKDEIDSMTPEDAAMLRTCVPEHVADFVGSMLMRDPAKRPTTAEARNFFLALHLATNGAWAIPSHRRAQVFSVASYLHNVPRAERHVHLTGIGEHADARELAGALAERFDHDGRGRVHALPGRVSEDTPTHIGDIGSEHEPAPELTSLLPASWSPAS